MSFSLIMSGQTAYEVLRLLAANSALSQQVRDYFKPRCDCDIVEWVKQRIMSADQEVVDAIRGMIQAEVVEPPPYPANALINDVGTGSFLTRTWCVAGTRMGEFIDTTGNKHTSTLWVGDPSCAP